ncbi:LysR family transcriptional regulator [Achromobacter insuavis]|uniref:LysR family regulatory protein n=1 Tax=Achromobacter insuavis AXX-A TaxID=1003200 RepID=F7T9C8_9BURK|nr:LysR family transcriptional regulator [Achromobacter insuavis]EGP43088.1 LysR family regulatory protein [Achromobacter insuavis AXX-A]
MPFDTCTVVPRQTTRQETTLDSISELELFQAIVERGGISHAAVALHSSPAAVSRRLRQLETRLGVSLANRSTRRFDLTDEGRLLYERAAAILESVRDVESEVSSRGTVARGLLRVGAPSDLGRRQLSTLLAQFARLHPGLEITLLLSDAGIENMLDGCDVVLRFGLPSDEGMVARKVATSEMLIVAAPSYLERHGHPATPEDLSTHNCLRLFRRHRVPGPWRFMQQSGWLDVHVKGTLASADGAVLREWALAGEGVSCEAAWDVAEDLAAGRLVRLLPSHPMQGIELYVVFAPGNPVPPRIRLLVDFLTREFGQDLRQI